MIYIMLNKNVVKKRLNCVCVGCGKQYHSSFFGYKVKSSIANYGLCDDCYYRLCDELHLPYAEMVPQGHSK